VADEVADIFGDLYQRGFAVERMKNVAGGARSQIAHTRS
jgi:uncharacterized protein (UPF0335 family)